MLNVAIVGAGNISTEHEKAWKNFSNAQVVAAFDVDSKQTEKYGYAHAYTDFDKMLREEKLDIIDICLPTTFHTEYAKKAMEAGINVICEKPISLERDDVELLYKTAEKNNVKFMVAQVVRFFGNYEIVKRIYDSNRFGRLLSGSMRRLGHVPKNNWMLNEKLSGGVTFDLHIHDVDFLVYAFGKPKAMKSFRAKEKNQDYVNATYEYDGFSVNTSASWFAAPYPFRMEFLFQFERAVVALENREFKIYTNEEIGENEFDIKDSGGYEDELRYFTDCVINDRPCDKVRACELETVIDILKKL